jgi:DNA replication and repair protein RecF
VQHRNIILNDEFASRNNKNIEIWDEQLIEYGSFILEKRYELVDFLNSNMSEYYQKFSKQKENIIVDYKSYLEKINSSNTKEKIKNIFKSNLKIIRNEEREKRVTLIGPHRDDLEFLKDGKSFKEYGSQGENKTLVIVLKILELIFVTDYVKKNPITLLDDIFGELDKSRMNGLLQFLKSIGQSFITTTIEEKFSDLDDKSNIKLENLIVNYA